MPTKTFNPVNLDTFKAHAITILDRVTAAEKRAPSTPEHAFVHDFILKHKGFDEDRLGDLLFRLVWEISPSFTEKELRLPIMLAYLDENGIELQSFAAHGA